MIPKFYNISYAMAAKRNTDKIVAILNNRFCLAYSQYTDGTYAKDISIHFLFKDVVYTLTHLECFKRAFCVEMNKYKGVKNVGFVRNFVNDYKVKVIDYRKSKQIRCGGVWFNFDERWIVKPCN